MGHPMVCPNIYIMVYHHWHQCPEASPISIPAMTQVKARKLRGGGDDCPPKNTEDMIIICMYVFFFPTVHCCFTLRPVSRETEFKSGYIYIYIISQQRMARLSALQNLPIHGSLMSSMLAQLAQAASTLLR